MKRLRESGAALWLLILKLWVYYRVEADVRAKCPACGRREQHKIAYSLPHEKLIHKCAVCMAVWAEPPIAKADLWRVEMRQEMEPEQEPEAPRPPFGAQREPMREPQVIRKPAA